MAACRTRQSTSSIFTTTGLIMRARCPVALKTTFTVLFMIPRIIIAIVIIFVRWTAMVILPSVVGTAAVMFSIIHIGALTTALSFPLAGAAGRLGCSV